MGSNKMKSATRIDRDRYYSPWALAREEPKRVGNRNNGTKNSRNTNHRCGWVQDTRQCFINLFGLGIPTTAIQKQAANVGTRGRRLKRRRRRRRRRRRKWWGRWWSRAGRRRGGGRTNRRGGRGGGGRRRWGRGRGESGWRRRCTRFHKSASRGCGGERIRQEFKVPCNFVNGNAISPTKVLEDSWKNKEEVKQRDDNTIVLVRVLKGWERKPNRGQNMRCITQEKQKNGTGRKEKWRWMRVTGVRRGKRQGFWRIQERRRKKRKLGWKYIAQTWKTEMRQKKDTWMRVSVEDVWKNIRSITHGRWKWDRMNQEQMNVNESDNISNKK